MFQIPTDQHVVPTNESKQMYERVVSNIETTNVTGLEEMMKFNKDIQNSGVEGMKRNVPKHDTEKIQRNMVSSLMRNGDNNLGELSNEAQETIDTEGYYKNRYSSVEGGTDTIGVGHKLSQEEHDGNYVTIGGQQIPLDNGLNDEQILQLWQQDDIKHTKRFEEDMTSRGIDPNAFDPKMKSVMKRLTYNMGSVPKSLTDSLMKGDMDEFNTGLLRMIGMKGNSVLSAGLSRDRARSYNTVNKEKVDSYEFLEREGGGSIYIYYDKDGNEIKKYETNKPLDKSNSYNKRYGL